MNDILFNYKTNNKGDTMLFRITNYCTENCPHCAQNSTPKGEFVSSSVVLDFINFTKRINLHPGLKVIIIGGGEPTSHPDFFTIMEMLHKGLPDYRFVIATNGISLVSEKEMRNRLLAMLVNIPLVLLQITSVRNLYRHGDIVIPGVHEILKKIPKKLRDRIKLVTKLENGITPVGRAKDYLLEHSIIANNIRSDSKATSCFNLFNLFQNRNIVNIFTAISVLKTNSRTSFCKPTIHENGNLVFGEYDCCSVVGKISDLLNNPILDINQIDGPCGSCISTPMQKTNIETYITQCKSRLKEISCDF